MPRTFKSSIARTSNRRTRSVVNLSKQSLRLSAMCAWCLATRSFCRRHRLLPLTRRERTRCNRVSFASVPHRVSRVGYSSPIGQGCQPADAKIDPDLLARLGKCGLGWFIQTKTHEISPGTVLGYRDRAWRTRELAAPLDVQATELGNAEILVFGIIVERGNGICRTLFPVLGMELGILRSLGEKVTESRLQVPQSLLLREHWTILSGKAERRIVPMFSPCRAAGVVVDR